MKTFMALLAPVAMLAALPAQAATPRELMVTAAFQTPDKAVALGLVDRALAGAQTAVAANPQDREAQIQRAFAIGYHAKLTRSAPEAKQARTLFEGLVVAYPRDPEAQLGLGGWHLDAIADGFATAMFLSAKKAPGLAGVDRAVALGGDRALFRTFAAMMRIRLDPKDLGPPTALAQAGAAGSTPTPLDMIAKRDAQALLIPLKAGDGKAAAALARKLLPFGRLG